MRAAQLDLLRGRVELEVAWAEESAPFILKLRAKENGWSLSVGGFEGEAWRDGRPLGLFTTKYSKGGESLAREWTQMGAKNVED